MRLDQCPLPLLNFQMQSTNAILFIGVILCSRECSLFSKCKVQIRYYLLGLSYALENAHLSKCKLQMRHYLLGLFYALANTPFSKCKVQIRYYLLGLFYALDNAHLSKCKVQCDIIY